MLLLFRKHLHVVLVDQTAIIVLEKLKLLCVHQQMDVSKVALLVGDKKDTTSRVGYKIDKDGNKVRVYKVNNKEIDV